MNTNKLKITALISLSLLSCKNNDSNKSSIEYKQLITYNVDFPDTVFVNEFHDGTVYYKSVLDTIITTFGDKNKNRYTRFIVGKDTFGALNNREIPFYDIKFSREGVYYLDGVINDIVLLDTFKNSKPQDKIELITNEVHIRHKVTVLSDK